MTIAPPTLIIPSQSDSLPTSTPHLLPFHIAYTGPAPISTYFRVRDAPQPTYGRDIAPPSTSLMTDASQTSVDSQVTLVASTTPSDSSLTTINPPAVNPTQNIAVGEPPLADHRYFTAAFRGRLMHGMKMDLPPGYAGIVLRAPEKHKSESVASVNRARQQEENAKSNGRSTRRTRRTAVVKDEDEDMDVTEDCDPSEEGATRPLQPISTFSSFVHWHPDIPVDEGRDEYLRSLTEWTKLAAEIHRVED